MSAVLQDKPQPEITPIVAGQLWAIPKDGPWGGHYPPVTILDVADGWVRYAHAAVFTDCRMDEFDFRRIYRFVGQA